jgi:aspartyl aminopeptidase
MTGTPDEARDLIGFIAQSPTPWHCAAHAADRLTALGSVPLEEGGEWALEPGRSYHVVREGAIVAWRMGESPAWEAGFRLVGAHTDSPGLRVKPTPDVVKANVRQLGVEVYGGALWYTWLDRDLGLSGRVFVRGSGPIPEVRLVDLRDGAICRIPSLAIHLQREVNTEGLKLNPQQHLPPLYAMASTATGLTTLLGEALGVDADAILSWDLALADVVPPAIGGFDGAFVFAPRLDNQGSCHAGLRALELAPVAKATQVLALYDHEECGSQSIGGADGPVLENVLRRICSSGAWGAVPRDAFERAASRSWHVSADMAHASHPNFEDKHEPQHKPLLDGGPVIKANTNQRYATSGEGAALFEAICRDVEVPVQKFVTRTDLACGTTIGPIAAARLGIRTVDVGNPMLSMHSIREQCAGRDQPRMIRALGRFFEV